MGKPATTPLDEAAASVRAAWRELAAIQGEDGPPEDDQDLRYITALWRVQNAEENYLRAQEEIFH